MFYAICMDGPCEGVVFEYGEERLEVKFLTNDGEFVYRRFAFGTNPVNCRIAKFRYVEI